MALHLERWREESSGQTEPVLIQVDGPGRTAFLDLLELRLDPACPPAAGALNAVVQRQIDSAYCVSRTTQLLSSHEVDDDDDAIVRLALWAIVELRWPLLAAHLKSRPDEISDFQNGRTPQDEELAAVLEDRVAHDLIMGVGDVRLCQADIERFTQPMKLPRKLRDPDEIGAVPAIS